MLFFVPFQKQGTSVAFRRGGAGKRRGGGESTSEGKRQRTMASLLTPEEKLGMPLETIIGTWACVCACVCVPAWGVGRGVGPVCWMDGAVANDG